MDKPKSPQDTLQDYFDDLLSEDQAPLASVSPISAPRPKPRLVTKAAPKTEFAEPEIHTAHKVRLEKLLKSTPVKAEAAVKPTLETKLEPQVKIKPEVEKKVEVEAEVVIPSQAVAEPAVESITTEDQAELADTNLESLPDYALEGLEWHENGRPPWAQEDFDVLLFKVAGLTLAVPLVALGQIQPITEELTPIFGQADWFMGLQPTTLGKIRTVNTALFVMPERYSECFLESAKLVISINGLPWGLAVDSVNQPITLKPDSVNWRNQRSKRAWLAGTVKEHMCALIDIPMMGKILLESDRNASKTKPS